MILNQIVFDAGILALHSEPMDELNEAPKNLLTIALFCAIIGLIGYANFTH